MREWPIRRFDDMRKKVLSLILLWAALLALALIYTDRDEYTWRYEGGELAQIVITREEADARQKQADEAMALMQQAAQARTLSFRAAPSLEQRRSFPHVASA